MSGSGTGSMTPFLLIVTLVLVLGGWMGWHTWNAPYDEDAAGRVGILATEVLIRAASGDASQCESMRTLSRPGDEDGAVGRCRDRANLAVSSGPGPLALSNLHLSNVDVDRNSGSVTVTGSLVNQGPMLQMRITWPVHRSGDVWRLSGAPDVRTE